MCAQTIEVTLGGAAGITPKHQDTTLNGISTQRDTVFIHSSLCNRYFANYTIFALKNTKTNY